MPGRSGLSRLAIAAAVTLAMLAVVPARADSAPPPLDNSSHLYTLDGFGGVHPDGTAPALAVSAYWAGHDIARGLAIFDDGTGGYVLDGYGGLHPVGGAPAETGPSWPNWDIARGIALLGGSSASAPAGYVLDGFGGVHPFGGAPSVTLSAYWPGWDIARGIALLPGSRSTPGGYVLDGDGGLHAFGSAPAVAAPATWHNWDIARGVALLPGATAADPAGYVLDGFGGLHPFGSAPAAEGYAYWPNWDIARGVVAWTGAAAGAGAGWTLDGFGGVHPFGGAPAVAAGGYWPNWDIARGLGGPGGDSGVRSVVTAGVIQNVDYTRQAYALSCEAAALQMVLSHEGIAVNQGSALNAFGIDGRSGYFDYYGTLHWGDPYTSFVGNPNGSEAALTGYGIYWPRVAAVAGSYGATVLRAGTGISPQAVYDLVEQGHPVIAWIAYDWRHHSSSSWIAFDGRHLGWAGPVEHAVAVIGINGTSVYVFNPSTGAQWVSMSAFAAAYSTYGDMAVAVS